MLEHGGVEIEDQSDSKAGDPKVREQLRCMNSIESVYSFNLDNDQVSDRQIGPMFRQQHAFVVQRDADLALESQASGS
jgi:hypothetical protein